MTRILVFGTGSIGSVYACLLHRAGAEVVCVCRSSYEAVKSHGLVISSPVFGDLRAHPTVVKNVAEAVTQSGSPFNIILVCTKATPRSTSEAIEAIRSAVVPGVTAIVIIQNGLGVERPFYEAFPGTSIISGVAYLPTTQLSPGVFSHSEMERLHLGLYRPESDASPRTDALDLIAQRLTSGGATVCVTEDIQGERWNKVLANGVVNPLCALSRCRDRELLETSSRAAALFRDVMSEIAAVGAAAGYGHVITESSMEKQLKRSSARPYPGVQPSMLSDAMAGRSMEVQAILGEIVQIAEEKRIAIPRLTTLFVLLEGLDFALCQEDKENLVQG
jgi:2-dehydropantoate 2-reductase